MFVQYSFVQHRPSLAAKARPKMTMTPAKIISAGIVAMVLTTLAYVLN
jgi:hypothetical protein